LRSDGSIFGEMFVDVLAAGGGGGGFWDDDDNSSVRVRLTADID